MTQKLKNKEIGNKSSTPCLFQHTILQTAPENSSLWLYQSTFPLVRWGIIPRLILVTLIVKGLTSHTYQLTLILTQSLTRNPLNWQPLSTQHGCTLKESRQVGIRNILLSTSTLCSLVLLKEVLENIVAT